MVNQWIWFPAHNPQPTTTTRHRFFSQPGRKLWREVEDISIMKLLWTNYTFLSVYSPLYACDDAVSHVYNMKTLTLSNDRICFLRGPQSLILSWSCRNESDWLYVWGSEYNVITDSQANSKCKEGTRVSFITDRDYDACIFRYFRYITEMTAFPCVFFLVPSTLFPRTKYTDKTRHDFKAPLGFTLCTGHTMSGFEVNKTTHAMQKKYNNWKTNRLNHIHMK